jgi:thioesterase domain-containing protein/acyl carrier protein
MVPWRFEWLDELPLTPSGKVDRQALRAGAAAPGEPDAASAGRFGFLGTQLREIFEDLLGVSGVGPRDDFLELGGDSLLAIEMLLRIERACGRQLAPSRLLGGPLTIDRLVDLLMEDEQANFGRPLVPVQGGGGRRPLFFLHGDHENGGLYCHALARCLGADQPFYAVTPHGLDGDALPWSLEAMARERLEAVRAVQPSGPYRLGGFCTGGIVAFEMARQLEARGEAVETLLLVDAALDNARLAPRLLARATRPLAAALGWSEEERRRVHLRLRSALDAFAASGRAGRAGRARFVAEKLRALPRRRPAPGAADALAPAIEGAFGAHIARHDAYGTRRRDYVPGRIAGRVALFRSDYLADEPSGTPSAGWSRVAAAVDVHPIPGSHQTAVTRHVATLAERMRPYLG